MVALICLLFGLTAPGVAATFKLFNGTTYHGEVVHLNNDGIVIKLDIGEHTERIELISFSQETLKQLARNSKYAPFVTPFIESTEEEPPGPPTIVLRPVERLSRPAGDSFLAAFASPIGFFFIIAFYLGNLLAAYEVAVYRGRSAPLVCGLAVIAPVVIPVIFLSLPAAEGSYADSSREAKSAESAPSPPPAEPLHPAGISSTKPLKLGLQQSASTQSASAKSSGAATSALYTRSNTDFNRHFFETTFSEFFRVVPSPAIKDMVIEFKGTKKELIAKRITRISANEIHVQLLAGNKEAALRFGEIIQVNLRHKGEK